MSVYAVRYSYQATAEAGAIRDEHRGAHRAFLGDLASDGTLLGSGPLTDATGPAALIVLRADSAEDVAELLREDPFQQQGLVESAQIEEWNLILGPWSTPD